MEPARRYSIYVGPNFQSKKDPGRKEKDGLHAIQDTIPLQDNDLILVKNI